MLWTWRFRIDTWINSWPIFYNFQMMRTIMFCAFSFTDSIGHWLRQKATWMVNMTLNLLSLLFFCVCLISILFFDTMTFTGPIDQHMHKSTSLRGEMVRWNNIYVLCYGITNNLHTTFTQHLHWSTENRYNCLSSCSPFFIHKIYYCWHTNYPTPPYTNINSLKLSQNSL